ncbi:hypothetical protein V490_06974 [Pseudogymnoascus sp. VKM F-3557]|nr:hypothetical protein V490_06974 [Pseudogymnoascus sp. VKM F-3557]
MALPTEVINEDTAADTPSPEKIQDIPVETDNIDELAGVNIKDFGKYRPDYREYGNYRSYRRDANSETTDSHIETDDADQAAVTSYKDYGEYGNYGSYPPHYTKYGTYGTYRRDANPKTTQDTQIETDDADGAATAGDAKYANYGKYPPPGYANYGKYPPPGYGEYGTYGKYPSRRSSTPEPPIDLAFFTNYGRPPVGYHKYPSRRSSTQKATTEFAHYNEYGKPHGGYTDYPDEAAYRHYGRSSINPADIPIPPPWIYRRNIALDRVKRHEEDQYRESSADAGDIIVWPWNRPNIAPDGERAADDASVIGPPTWAYGPNIAPYGVKKRQGNTQSWAYNVAPNGVSNRQGKTQSWAYNIAPNEVTKRQGNRSLRKLEIMEEENGRTSQ